MLKYIQLIRVNDWIKNLFLFLPVFFAGEFFNFSKLILLLIGFISFCATASSIYILNDLRDIEFDRLHPEKCKRPLASGRVNKRTAIFLTVVFAIVGFLIAYILNEKFLFIILTYFILNVLYSFGLKNFAIIDLIIISIGFFLRIKGGGVLGDVVISRWLIVMVFLLSLFLGFAKRRDDLLIKDTSGYNMRLVLKNYNLDFINGSLIMIAGVIIVAYLMYTFAPQTEQNFNSYRVYYTSFFVITGMLRYMQMIFVENKTGSPTKILLKDFFIQGIIICWIVSYFMILYFTNVTFFHP